MRIQFRPSSWTSIVVVLTLVILIWIAFAIFLVGPTDVLRTLKSPHRLSISQLGAFGDSFAVLTCAFSGLAFAAVLVTLGAQRSEMREMREQMRTDRLNAHFMLLFSELKSARSEIKVQKTPNFIREGADGVFTIQEALMNQLKERAAKQSEKPLIEVLRETIRGNSDPVIREISLSAQRYFSLTRAIIEVVFNSPKAERAPYIALIRALLTTSDFFLIHHYFLANTDKDFHVKIEDIEFFASIGAILSLVMLAPGPFYSPSAYACEEEKWEAMMKVSRKNAA